MRRLVLAGALLSATLVPAAPAAALPTPFTVVTVEGKGFGHGVGMAQDGILTMGRAGASTASMLSHFYPGTSMGSSKGTVRVVVLAGGGAETVLSFPDGGRIDAPGGGEGFPVRVDKGSQVRVAFENGRYVVGESAGSPPSEQPPGDSTTSTSEVPEETTTSTTQPPITVPRASTSTSALAQRQYASAGQASSAAPLKATPSSGGTIGLPSGRRYRGLIDIGAEGAALRLVNALDVETYLKGMGEVRDSSWPAAALRAQAIAARTYALRAMSFGGEICADQRCQVYLGAQAEYAAMNKAVDDTAGQIVVHNGKPASTVYSANGGGHSASREEGFGSEGGAYPYLRANVYKTSNPLPWTERISTTDVARALGYKGELTDVRILRSGPSGRALAVELEGSAGRLEVTGRVFDARLGLKSTLFKLSTGRSSVPAPPRDASFAGEQALPEEAVALPPRPPDPPLPAFPTSTTQTPSILAAASVIDSTGSSASGVLGPLALFLLIATALALGGYWIARPRAHG